MNSTRVPRPLLALALLAISALFAVWFGDDRHFLATLLVFTLPPMLLAIGARLGWRLAVFWSGVFALGWFSHGVMVAWSHPERRLYGWLELLLALVVVFASSWTGLRARLARRSEDKDSGQRKGAGKIDE